MTQKKIMKEKNVEEKEPGNSLTPKIIIPKKGMDYNDVMGGGPFG